MILDCKNEYQKLLHNNVMISLMWDLKRKKKCWSHRIETGGYQRKGKRQEWVGRLSSYLVCTRLWIPNTKEKRARGRDMERSIDKWALSYNYTSMRKCCDTLEQWFSTCGSWSLKTSGKAHTVPKLQLKSSNTTWETTLKGHSSRKVENNCIEWLDVVLYIKKEAKEIFKIF